jgi:hypothetical protein
MRLKTYVLTPDMARWIDLLQFLFMTSFHLGLFQGNVEETELGCVRLDFLKCYIRVSTPTQPDFSCHTPPSFSNECQIYTREEKLLWQPLLHRSIYTYNLIIYLEVKLFLHMPQSRVGDGAVLLRPAGHKCRVLRCLPGPDPHRDLRHRHLGQVRKQTKHTWIFGGMHVSHLRV